VLNGIAASATYSDHLDDGAVRFGFQHLEFHVASVKIKNSATRPLFGKRSGNLLSRAGRRHQRVFLKLSKTR
jgi:hypothetical protein